jgi:nucleoporin POM152
MNGTPRLRSAFPTTPQSSARKGGSRASSQNEDERPRRSLPQVSSSAQVSAGQSSPLIPFSIIDGPTQRLYICALFVALNAWRLYDWFKLVQDDAESVWLFLKWTAIDGIALFNIPVLRVPWFEWSFALSTTFFLASALLNGLLMFRIAASIFSFLNGVC